MADSPHGTVTRLLRESREGDERALDRVVPLVYDELHRLAERQMRGENVAHTLQPTALIHEAYARLAGTDLDWNDRAHFLAVASRVMRRVLVDHARSAGRQKRGGGRERVTLTDAIAAESGDFDVLDLDDALSRLGALDERKAKVVELCYFAGLTYDEIASALGISATTVHRELAFSKAWLRSQLAPPSE